MGGKTVSERVDAFAFLNAAFVLGAVIDLLGGADVQGLISAFTEEDPQCRLIGLLVFLQLAQQALGKNRVTAFFPFACSTRIIMRSGSISLSLRWISSSTRSPAEYAVISKHRSRSLTAQDSNCSTSLGLNTSGKRHIRFLRGKKNCSWFHPKTC